MPLPLGMRTRTTVRRPVQRRHFRPSARRHVIVHVHRLHTAGRRNAGRPARYFGPGPLGSSPYRRVHLVRLSATRVGCPLAATLIEPCVRAAAMVATDRARASSAATAQIHGPGTTIVAIGTCFQLFTSRYIERGEGECTQLSSFQVNKVPTFLKD